MKTNTMLRIGLIASALIFIIGCSKEPGVGGSASIAGSVKSVDAYNPVTGDTTFYDVAKKDVYIIYGDDPSVAYHDNYETSWNGQFRFDYLRKGTYQIYVLEDCNACPGGSTSVFKSITIDKNGTDNEIGVFSIDDDEVFLP